jgi:hypothetical protein
VNEAFFIVGVPLEGNLLARSENLGYRTCRIFFSPMWIFGTETPKWATSADL